MLYVSLPPTVYHGLKGEPKFFRKEEPHSQNLAPQKPNLKPARKPTSPSFSPTKDLGSASLDSQILNSRMRKEMKALEADQQDISK